MKSAEEGKFNFVSQKVTLAFVNANFSSGALKEVPQLSDSQKGTILSLLYSPVGQSGRGACVVLSSLKTSGQSDVWRG